MLSQINKMFNTDIKVINNFWDTKEETGSDEEFTFIDADMKEGESDE